MWFLDNTDSNIEEDLADWNTNIEEVPENLLSHLVGYHIDRILLGKHFATDLHLLMAIGSGIGLRGFVCQHWLRLG